MRPRENCSRRAGLSFALFALLGCGVVLGSVTKRHIDIGAGPAAVTLAKLIGQTGAQILFASEVVAGRETRRISGDFYLPEALRQMLEGSGLTFKLINDNTATITAAGGPSTAAGGSAGPARMAAAEGAAAGTPSDDSHAAAAASQSELQRKPVEEVVVTGTQIRNVSPTSPVITIDRQQILHSGYQNVGQVMRSLPESFGGGNNVAAVGSSGSRNTPSGSGASTANLRGLGSDSTLTLINGHRMAYDGATGSVDISAIPLAAIRRVEILTDGASALYGSDAVAGVVNIILDDAYNGLEIDASAGTAMQGGGLQQQYTALGGTGWQGGHVMASYEYARQNRIDSADRAAAVAGDLAGTSLIPRIERNTMLLTANQQLAANLSAYLQSVFTIRSAADTQNDEPFSSPGVFGESAAHVRQYGIAGGIGIALPNEWRATIGGNFSADRLTQHQRELADGVISVDQSAATNNLLRSVDLTADGILADLPSGKARLAIGAGYRNERFELAQMPGALAPISASREVRYAFAEANVPLVRQSADRLGLEALELSLAGRYENYADLSSTANPRLGISYTPVSDIRVRASWGKSFRAPSLTQQFAARNAFLFAVPNTAGGSSVILYRSGGDLALEPEKSTTWTTGFDYKSSLLPGFNAHVTYFNLNYRKRIDTPISNLFASLTDSALQPFISANPTEAAQAAIIANAALFFNLSGLPYDPATVAAVADSRFQNISRSSVNGVDVALAYAWSSSIGNFGVNLNGSFLRLRDQFLSASPEVLITGTVFNPPHARARAQINWQLAGWTASVFANYVGPSQDPAALPPVEVASWTTFDAEVGYEFDQGRFRVDLSAQNLFDRDPPFVDAATSSLPGIHFDSTNTSAVGRFVVLRCVANIIGWD